jgi:hypothetical protein
VNQIDANTAYAALYPNVVSVPAADRNLLWLVFTDDIEGFTPQVRLFRHPVVGDLQLEQHRLAASDEPNLLVVIHANADDGRS